MSKIDCNNMDERHVCKLDECTCGYTKGKCEDMTCKDYVSNNMSELEKRLNHLMIEEVKLAMKQYDVQFATAMEVFKHLEYIFGIENTRKFYDYWKSF